ncbi:glycosyltransferase family 4 protein [Acetobacter sacchari]|uniref:Glycosyltransferase family 4 protein n=1 Tax=Acetobacter sacchari TaxID=2661687 RepID=A0ABS3LT51_9PROT|nr:glycosyltransferase family 1 protein [Acetobacter sacchari]MBO1359074.1 glycosyltransferase family 4 protein [Acetobacter sacchari]
MARPSSDKTPAYTLWVDVDDLFQYAISNPRPSGIQRLVYEILRVLEQRATTRPDGPRVVFVRRGADGSALSKVAFRDIQAIFDRLSGDTAHTQSTTAPRTDRPTQKVTRPTPTPTSSAPADRRVKRVLKRLLGKLTPVELIQHARHSAIRRLEALPPSVANPFITAGVMQVRTARLARRYWSLKRARRLYETAHGDDANHISAATPTAHCAEQPVIAAIDSLSRPSSAISTHDTAPSDIFLVLGAPWSDPLFGERLRVVREIHGLRPVLLLYDLIPVRRPEWCAQSLVEVFRHWLDSTLPQCTHLLAISDATARDVERYAEEEGLHLADKVRTIRLGTGFGLTAQQDEPKGATPPGGLPKPGTYVLFVSTMEARKNHALLFRVWRRLIAELGADAVPTLVFAGRVGWLVADLMQQLENTDWLDGKIRLLRDPSDEELRWLYRGCMFTVFPSLFEGWGLPVTESLMMGSPCVASNVTSVPEAGGAFARYFNPESAKDATTVIRDVIADRAGLALWREQVTKDFPRVSWEATADAVLDACAAAHKPEGADNVSADKLLTPALVKGDVQ